ncbi:hypothetical protein [Colwellia sp. Arc7-D]|jgi:hypothetical protein|uniref:hypothetical protein n=1 Tax=Colwellia sp. Arc7-D TaxID=2161872 RepID=UPI000D3B63D6|nr:hypothetical protein [Colwellia sp. Arc7-D]AWB57758.1 hypothetical protein DBO93_09360 [Colwellia sp. Arc7-D]|tara:strand:- start:3449 stop:4345 length:897 start_codon:yes stop_codon:yes gene_type:complete
MKKTLAGFFTGSAIAVVIIIATNSYKLYKNKSATIDPQLKEISGIEFDKNRNLWAINDGGDDAKLYQINNKGSIEKTITVTNAKNIDWEDMTQDDFGHFFLGDFGNNDNLRKWLTIYKIENPIDIKGDVTEAEIIKFKYPEHVNFPPKPSEMEFDVEAFVFYKRHLYLFTKNRMVPFNGITNLYKIGDHAANYDAKKISKFKTCTLAIKLCWITSAALSPNKKRLALLDSQRIWLFENWQGDDFFSGDKYRIDLGIVTQKEAITFVDEETIIFTDEEFHGIGRNIYEINLNNVTKNKL